MSNKPKPLCFIAIVLAGLSSMPAGAEEFSLLQIMQQLGRDLNQISDGMWREDYAAIAAAAQSIAEHPQPPMAERSKIISGLGADAGRFRQGDQTVHDAAMAVKEAAGQENNEHVLKRYNDLVKGCMDCHTNFRARVRDITGQ